MGCGSGLLFPLLIFTYDQCTLYSYCVRVRPPLPLHTTRGVHPLYPLQLLLSYPLDTHTHSSEEHKSRQGLCRGTHYKYGILPAGCDMAHNTHL